VNTDFIPPSTTMTKGWCGLLGKRRVIGGGSTDEGTILRV